MAVSSAFLSTGPDLRDGLPFWTRGDPQDFRHGQALQSFASLMGRVKSSRSRCNKLPGQHVSTVIDDPSSLVWQAIAAELLASLRG